ncbi:MAG: nucleoside 2-deoxyribosyltransferase domain-containing protein [Asticcacaulis sp.]|nr:nucleoside 2-deoxyribosyltransferase domain-containing protein [Asticcacaulis sp.]
MSISDGMPAGRIVQPPLNYFKTAGDPGLSIFTGGTIDMGESDNWQDVFIAAVRDRFSLIYNPRRGEWDASWTQSIDSPDFNVQVNWELQAIERADVVFLYFAETSKSPITLMELGIASQLKPSATIVACPKGFYRRGNIEIVCNRYGLVLLDDLQAGIDYVRDRFST